jgi:hypothetical protein
MFRQCCGTVRIYCGSGSGSYCENFWFRFRLRFRFPTPVPISVPDPDLFGTVYNNNRIVQKHCFPERRPLFFLFFDFCINLLSWIRVQIQFRNRNALRFRFCSDKKLQFLLFRFRLQLRFHNTVCRACKAWGFRKFWPFILKNKKISLFPVVCLTYLLH